MNILQCLNPGDYCDKFTILMIKLHKCPEHVDIIEDEWRKVNFILNELVEFYDINCEQLYPLIAELYEINRAQWDLEDKVRKETSGESAYLARINNSKRIDTKNKINELFGYSIEVKRY